MTDDDALRNEQASGTVPATLLQRGFELLEAQRTALVGGDPDRLAAANAGLDAWLAGLSRAQAGNAGSSLAIGRSDATRLRDALHANAAVAQRAAAGVQRALAALLPPPPARTYDADGRASDRAAARTSIQA
jgi:hypothetical protein